MGIKSFVLLLCIIIITQHYVYTQNYVLEKNIVYKLDDNLSDYEKEKCKLDISYKKSGSLFPVIIYLHGGGLTSGTKQFISSFLEEDFVNVAVGYRLSPNVKCPAYIEDVSAAVSWVWNNIEKYGGDKNRIFLIGHSAGAYLTAMIALDKRYLEKYAISPDYLAGYVCLSGQMTTHYTILKERGIIVSNDSKFVDEYAPLFHVREIKPFIVFAIGERSLDLVGRFEQNYEIVEKLRTYNNRTCLWEFLKTNHEISMINAATRRLLPMLIDNEFEITDFYGEEFNAISKLIDYKKIEAIYTVTGVRLNTKDIDKISPGLYVVFDGDEYEKIYK